MRKMLVTGPQTLVNDKKTIKKNMHGLICFDELIYGKEPEN